MGELAGVVIGWREVVVGVIVLVAIYMLVVVLRMRGLRHKASPGVVPAPVVEPGSVASEPVLASSVMPVAEESEPRVAETWQSTAGMSAQEVFIQGVEAEVVQLRDEVDALRGELAALRDELHNELAHLRATQTVSPLYSDAMQMATLGHDAALIAERCGISRAEAELMVALVKNQEEGGAG